METTSRACRWVCRRLPLLAGDELAGIDRRRVERHLITCPTCRSQLAAATQSVEFLRAVGVATRRPSADAAPSLWPVLAQQIHESRREAQDSAPWPLIASLGVGRPWLRTGLKLAAAAGLTLAAGLLVRSGMLRTDSVTSTVARVDPLVPTVAREAPSLSDVGDRPSLVDLGSPLASPRSDDPNLPLVRSSRRPSPLPDGQPAPATNGGDPFQPPLPLWTDFDLDRGTLSGSGNLNTQRAY